MIPVQRVCPAEAGYTARAPAEFGARHPAKPHACGTGLGQLKTAAGVGELDARMKVEGVRRQRRLLEKAGGKRCWAPAWISPVVLGSGGSAVPPWRFFLDERQRGRGCWGRG